MLREKVIRWAIKDPLGNNVVLKQSTYEYHVIGDHFSRDANFRKEIENLAKQTILNPILVVTWVALRKGDKIENGVKIYELSNK